ncbi:type II toxin-antitoxin system RelE/ParE family toxin [Pontibacter locisalis]|uniref:Type II toxin-antitoxin system RelE/ParE family toxin n=1 Tax=Pontibacter locisalis TaxID=1719035 RepID=A0ABW5IRE6_9BACT
MQQKFEVDLLEEAFKYLESLELKHREKILQNIRRAQFHIDPKLFKKLTNEIWEFRTLYAGLQFRLLAFWDKTDKKETLVLATHGFVKKTSKVDKKEIDKAERIREMYFKEK